MVIGKSKHGQTLSTIVFLVASAFPLEKVTITYSIQSLHEEKKQHSFHTFEMIPLDQVLLQFGTWSDELHDHSQEQDYYYRHKDQIVQKSMEYYNRHKRAINRKRKEGYECTVCHGHYTLNNRAAHYQTQKHLEATGKN